jgi:small subunit ribosomal protein S20
MALPVERLRDVPERRVDKAGLPAVRNRPFTEPIMPNTKSAEKRVRSSARKAARNQSVKSAVKTHEKKYLALVTAGKLEEAKTALSTAISAYAKAAKGGVIKKETASRKTSRLRLRLNRASEPKAA